MNQCKIAAASSVNEPGCSLAIDPTASDREVVLVRKLRRIEDFMFKTFMAMVTVVLAVAAIALCYFLIASTISGVVPWPIALALGTVLLVVVALVVHSVGKRISLRRQLAKAGYFNLDKNELSKWLDAHPDLKQELFALEAARM